MSAFKAINIESDNESDEEVDDTKEIQIEEALKLYQTALKYHAEGPASFEQAEQAYKDLFQSEIFKYAESLSEYRRLDLYGDTLEYDSITQAPSETGPVQLVTTAGDAPNTLPQIIHLSFKNYGQFMLDVLQHRLGQHAAATRELQASRLDADAAETAKTSLYHFAEALDKDDADLDLWTRSSSVAAFSESGRMVRFCLEAVLDGDEEGVDSILQIPGIEQGFAGQQLRELVSKLQDTLSLGHPPLSLLRQKKLSARIKRALNPYSFAPLPAAVRLTTTPEVSLGKKPVQRVLKEPGMDWASLGDAILQQFFAEQSGQPDQGPGVAIKLELPSAKHTDGTKDIAGDQAMQDQQHGVAVLTIRDEPSTADGTQEDAGAIAQGQERGDRKIALTSQDQPEAPNEQSRKRSTDSAGLPETAEGGRGRSKRIRARESIVEGLSSADAAGIDLSKKIENDLWNLEKADQFLYEIINEQFGRFQVDGYRAPKRRKEMLLDAHFSTSGAAPTEGLDKATIDLYNTIKSASPKSIAIFLNGESVEKLGSISREAGLNTFLGHAKPGDTLKSSKPYLRGSDGVAAWCDKINSNWLSTKEVAFSWMESLLRPDFFPDSSVPSKQLNQSSYMRHRWSDDLKRSVVQIIVHLDEYIYLRLSEEVSAFDQFLLSRQTQGLPPNLTQAHESLAELVQALFELHLDVYSLIKHPGSGVDMATQMSQNDRLERWAGLARDIMTLRTSASRTTEYDTLALRHIWASVFHTSVCETDSQQHIVFCIDELKTVFMTMGSPEIEVPNNAVMPILSVASAEEELAKISMRDFFFKVFDHDENDPVAVIENLEPLLEPSTQYQVDMDVDPVQEVSSNGAAANGHNPSRELVPSDGHDNAFRPSPFDGMRRFLNSANIPLRLSMWQRLREAYDTIDYPPKVVSCYLRSIEMLVHSFDTPAYTDTPDEQREAMLLNWVRIIGELLQKALAKIKTHSKALECMDNAHLHSSMSSIAQLLSLVSAVDFFEDMHRVGQLSPTTPSGTSTVFTGKLHDMQMNAWLLQYLLLKEAMDQNPEIFPKPTEDKLEYLRHVHYAAGTRGYCHYANKAFLRLLKDEVLLMTDFPDPNTRDIELAQVLRDLYGLKPFVNPNECLDYGCDPYDPLERKTASQLLPFIMSQARKISIKELHRTEMKNTIDKVHGMLGRPKANEDMALNRKVLSSFLKSPINPVSLYRCLSGIGSLPTKPISPSEAIAASHGWYFLMGSIALNKWRTQKRVAPVPTEDISFAVAFFMQDLDYATDRWETWYRLAQAHDTQLEDAVAWSAEKLNTGHLELVQLQRFAIHSYTMAVACAVRDADTSPETMSKVSELYADFGTRIYSSTREPFSMAALELRATEQKWYSHQSESQGVYQGLPFRALPLYTAWKFASSLFKRAIAGNPRRWTNHFMLGKCLWKMHTADDSVRGKNRAPSAHEVIECFIRAIDVLPERKDSRRDPVLEPHYHLVSIVHKLFQRKELNLSTACEVLQRTSYARNKPLPEGPDGWKGYILRLLKCLRAADKSGWHHRMTVRAAHIIYDEDQSDEAAAEARHDFEQHIFTKAMAIQVWKPENERPGRHFVYTTRYTRFFMRLLLQLNDRYCLEMLARRVRKKPQGFFQHSLLWQELCTTCIKLLRRTGNVPEGHEDTVFRLVSHDDFLVRAARIEAWAQKPGREHPVLDVLERAVELKRLNNSLMKPGLLDDLIIDTYALLYATVGSTLEPLPSETSSGANGPSTVPSTTNINMERNMMSLTSLMNMDGAHDGSHKHMPLHFLPPGVHQAPVAETAPRPKKGVGRRELQRRAEACVNKMALPPLSTSTTNIPIEESPGTTYPPATPSRIEIVISQRPPDPSTLHTPRGQAATTSKVPFKDGKPNAAASGHGSADEESELSELDEEDLQEGEQEQTDGHHPDERFEEVEEEEEEGEEEKEEYIDNEQEQEQEQEDEGEEAIEDDFELEQGPDDGEMQEEKEDVVMDEARMELEQEPEGRSKSKAESEQEPKSSQEEDGEEAEPGDEEGRSQAEAEAEVWDETASRARHEVNDSEEEEEEEDEDEDEGDREEEAEEAEEAEEDVEEEEGGDGDDEDEASSTDGDVVVVKPRW